MYIRISLAYITSLLSGDNLSSDSIDVNEEKKGPCRTEACGTPEMT